MWVLAGSPEVELPRGQQLADGSHGRRAPQKQELIVRGQSPSEDPFLNEPAVALLDTATTRQQGESHTRLTAVESRALPVRRQKKTPPATDSPTVDQIAGSDRNDTGRAVDEDLSRNESATNSPATENPPRVIPRKNPQRIQVAETRSSASPRQATEWSEFPQDPRPSPLILRGRR